MQLLIPNLTSAWISKSRTCNKKLSSNHFQFSAAGTPAINLYFTGHNCQGALANKTTNPKKNNDIKGEIMT